MPTLKDGHVVITGGTGALGVAVVRALVEAGAECHVPAIETSVPADRFPTGKVSVTTHVDLSDEAAVAAFYAKLPPLAGVVNIAGGFAWAPITDSPLKVVQQQMSMNFFSCALSCREAVTNFRKAGKGGEVGENDQPVESRHDGVDILLGTRFGPPAPLHAERGGDSLPRPTPARSSFLGLQERT